MACSLFCLRLWILSSLCSYNLLCQCFSFSPSADNKFQSETRRRKRRWNGERSVPRVPTGSTVPYCDPPPLLLSLSVITHNPHTQTHMHTNTLLDVRELPSSIWLLEHKKEGGDGHRTSWWIQSHEGWNEPETCGQCPISPSQGLGMSAVPSLLTFKGFSWPLVLPFLYLTLNYLVT